MVVLLRLNRQLHREGLVVAVVVVVVVLRRRRRLRRHSPLPRFLFRVLLSRVSLKGETFRSTPTDGR